MTRRVKPPAATSVTLARGECGSPERSTVFCVLLARRGAAYCAEWPEWIADARAEIAWLGGKLQ
jgi:hypothetical protein